MLKKSLFTLSSLILLSITLLVQAEEGALAKITPPPIQDSNSNDAQTIARTTAISPLTQAATNNEKPQATVLTCSDSPIHTDLLAKTSGANLFMISNIGNQITTALGSVDYGINYLGSSLLLIVGHAHCKAIHTANNAHTNLGPALIKELNTLHIAQGLSDSDKAKTNVNNQVAIAIKEYTSKIKSGELLVVGAIYESADETKQSKERLNIINVNGETDPAKLKRIAATVAQAGPIE